MVWVNANEVITTSKIEGNDIEIKTILIDPGHGGMDGGAVAKDGTNEKNINLNIGLLLGANLKSQGYNVEYTRTEDVGLYTEGKTVREKKYEDLNNRVKMKKDTGCNLFISIHLNTFPQANCKGAQVWYSNAEGSQELASIIQDTMKERLDPSNKRQAKPAGKQYKVLRENDTMPSVLVECGFISNGEDLAKLKDENYQQKIADALSESICNFAKKQDN